MKQELNRGFTPQAFSIFKGYLMSDKQQAAIQLFRQASQVSEGYNLVKVNEATFKYGMKDAQVFVKDTEPVLFAKEIKHTYKGFIICTDWLGHQTLYKDLKPVAFGKRILVAPNGSYTVGNSIYDIHGVKIKSILSVDEILKIKRETLG